MRRLLAILSVFALAGCATAGGEDGMGAEGSAEATTTASAVPTPGAEFVADGRFATVRVDAPAAVPDVGPGEVRVRLDGNCAFAEAADGSRVFLIWPEGHIRFDAATERMWFLDIFGNDSVIVALGQSVDLRTVPVPTDEGSQPLDLTNFVVPPDPSCPDETAVLVTGMTTR